MHAMRESVAAGDGAPAARPRADELAVRLATELAVVAQEVVEKWRPHERHSIGGQLCRAALSVSANLVEARSRRSAKERLRFVEIADGSLQETGHLIGVAAEMRLFAAGELERSRELHEAATLALARRRRGATISVARSGKTKRRTPALASARASTTLAPVPVQRTRGRKQRGQAAARIALKPADPFELIRWLARSQSDPRKAVAELVQNSLDAGARRVEIRRQRVRKRLCIVVRDDGEGVLPELEREEALRYLATHVGHSHKMGLDAAERAARVVAGKYGVGLLGFWSIGRTLELRTRVAGSPLHALRLVEDSPSAEIDRLPLATDAPETFTEVLVADVHEAANRALGGRRLTDYLAAELRGQLLAREVELVVHDHVARGLAQKRFTVVPRRYTGERLNAPGEVPVEGFTPARIELYIARGVERAAIEVACAGTLVADDVAELRALGLDRAPWVGRELSGVIDFPSFNVPPGTRRGVAPDRAALAFAAAMDALAPVVTAELDRLDEERRAALDRNVHRELEQALRGLARRLPQFELPHVEGRGAPAGEEEAPSGGAQAPSAASEQERESDVEAPALFPPGPLAAVSIVPAAVEVAPGGERRVGARAVDAGGRAVADVDYTWSVEAGAGAGIELRQGGARPAVCVRPDAVLGSSGAVRVEARHEDVTVSATASVAIVEPEETAEAALGIPEPHLVSDAAGRWRSRMHADRWEVNDAHEDYRAVRASPRGRMRYLLALLAREIVLRTAGRPDAEDIVDNVVAILAHAERNLRGR